MTSDWEKSLKRWNSYGSNSSLASSGLGRTTAAPLHHKVKVDEVDKSESFVAPKSFQTGTQHLGRKAQLAGNQQEDKYGNTKTLTNWRSLAIAKTKTKAQANNTFTTDSKKTTAKMGGQPQPHQGLAQRQSNFDSFSRFERAKRMSRPSSTSTYPMGDLGFDRPQSPKAPEAAEVGPPSSSPPPYPALPEGVVCIDPEAHDTTMSYPMDHINYLRFREVQELAERNRARGGQLPPKVLLNRSNLSGWLIAVAHYLRCSQETLYQTINLLDKVCERCKFSSGIFQAIGMACLLVATKLEEYHPADLDVLVKLADLSYTRVELIKAEAMVLKTVDFETWTVEPMGFLKWFARAAHREADVLFLELCYLLVDTFIMEYDLWRLPPSLKAASAVYGALKLYPEGNQSWTPTLTHYTGYTEEEPPPTITTSTTAQKRGLASCAVRMLELLTKALRSSEEKSNNDYWSGLVDKYSSNSKHNGLLRTGIVTVASVKLAVSRIQEKRIPHLKDLAFG